MHITRWISRAATLCVVGPIAARLAQGVHAPDGAEGASFLVSETPARGMIVLAIVLAMTGLVGVLIARVSTRREAMLNMSFVLGWVAWTSGRMGELFRVDQSGFVMLAIEAALIGCVVVAVMVVASGTQDEDSSSRFDPKTMLAGKGGISLFAAAIVTLAIVWLFGQTDLPGQSLWSSFAGGVAAGLVGAMVQQSSGAGTKGAHPRQRDPETTHGFAPMIVGVLFAGVLAPLVGMFVPGSGGVLKTIGLGTLPGWLAVSPIAWSVGALLGVPIGWGWVESTVAMQETSVKHA